MYRTYTEYEVFVLGFNKNGVGPKSEVVRAFTGEGTPQQPPKYVSCTSISSTNMVIAWHPPSSDTVQGKIIKYELTYGPSDTWMGKSENNFNS